MVQWQPDGISPPSQGRTASSVQPATISGQEGEGSVSVKLLASVLAGTVTPQSIPVSVYLPSTILPPLAQTNPSASHFGLEGLGVGPPPVSGGSSAGSLFGSTDIDMDMDMEIPGLSMSMNPGIDISMAGMGIELTSSPVPSRPSPMIVLSSPARAPAAGLVELRVSFGEGNGRSGNTSPDCGVRVESLPGVDTHGMDEVVRRGGIWGLPGRVWATKVYKQ
jgi:hypothetical protein